MEKRPDFKFRHVGINAKDNAEAEATTMTLSNIFGIEYSKLPGSYLVGDHIEVMNHDNYGKFGHIAFTVASIADAVGYLNEHGWEADMSTAVYKDDRIKILYLSQEVAGFAIHLFEE